MGGLKTTNNTLKSLGLFDKQASGAGGSALSNATLAEQQAQTALLTQILAETDYEHTITYGRDSLTATVMQVQNDSYTQYQGVDPTPPITTPTPANNLVITNSNNNFYAEFEVTPLTLNPEINFTFNAKIISCAAATGDVTIEFYGDAVNLLDTVVVINNGSSGDDVPYNFIFDNSITLYSAFTIRVYQTDSLGTISVNYLNFRNNATSVINTAEDSIIKRVDFYEDNTLISTSYFDSSDNSHTLVGVFIPNENIDSTILDQDRNVLLNSAISELSKLTSSNLPSHEQLTDPVAVSYTGFKKLSFICSGAIDVLLDGNTITYPFTLGSSPILGSTIEADESSLNSIEFDGTGTVLITIKQ